MRVEAYWERKNAELALLAEAAGLPAPRVGDGEALWREKQRLRAALLARTVVAQAALGESSPRDPAAPEHARFRYSYQRFDLRVRGRRMFESIYPLDPRGGLSLGVWGGSGMGVITATLRALDGWLDRPHRLLLPADAYFETLRLAQRLERLLINDVEDDFLDGDFFYLDSVTVKDHFPLLTGRALGALRLVLFDTTLYDPGSPLVDRVVARCRAEGVPLLCLRSHLKLDCLSTEYARLGSAVLLIPPRPPPAVVALARALRSELLAELALAGAMPTPAAFFPLAGDPRCRALSAERHARMVAAQARAAAGLRARLRRARLVEPHHGCFLLLDPFPVRQHALRAALVALAGRLRDAGVAAAPLPSFGYDLVALTCLAELTGASLRLAVPDLPDALVDRLVDVVADFFAAC